MAQDSQLLKDPGFNI